jgi:putative ABC transport system permease protein
LTAHPQVESAGFIQTLPLKGSYELSFDIRGRAPAKPGEGASAHYRAASGGFFGTLRVGMVRGRGFTAADNDTSQHVAIVDEAFAAKYFPTEDAIGQGLHIGNGADGFYDIVGIVRNVHHDSLDTVAAPTMYVPIKQDRFPTMWVVARGKGDAASLTSVVRGVLHDIDPTLPAFSVATLDSIVAESVAQRRFSMLLLSLFAGVALFLAGVGLYGVVAYGVSQRTREIGLRMAIGAQPMHVLTMVVGGGMKVAAIGVVIGVGASLALAQLIKSMLFDVTPFDAMSYAATAGVLLIVAALACYLPARRARRVDPTVALQG